MRAAGQKEYVNLAKGLMTEVSPLSFPEGATSNELNFTINKDSDKPILLEYLEATSSIVVNTVSLHVRDFELVNDGLTASENPTSLTDNHKYNLYNAGWFVSKKDEKDSNVFKNTATAYHAAFSKYPSNADSVSVGMITNASGVLTFDADYVRDAGLGNSLSPRGHYVFPIDTYDRTTKLASPLSDGAPSTTLTVLGTITLSGTPSYNPDTPNTGGGSGAVPFEPYPQLPADGGQIP